MVQALRYLSVLIILFDMVGCYPLIQKEITEPPQALKRIRYFWPEFRDDMDTSSLNLAIERSLEYLNRLEPDALFVYGPDTYPAHHVRESLEIFSQIIKQNYDLEQFNREIREKFSLYRASGSRGNRKILFTGYFEPILNGSLTPDSVYQHPIYRSRSISA